MDREKLLSLIQNDETWKVLYFTKSILELPPRITHISFTGFSSDIIKLHGSYLGFDSALKLISNKELILKKLCEDNDILWTKYTVEGIGDLIKRSYRPPPLVDPFERLYCLYLNYHKDNNLVDDDSALYFVLRILSDRPRVLRHLKDVYKHAFSEEEDLNHNQKKLLEALCI